MDSRWLKVRTLFDSLAGLATAQRIHRLALLNDQELVAELRDLLDHFDDAGSDFLATLTGPTIAIPHPATTCYTFHPGDLVAERFLIVRPIGSGGMGEVYEANDAKSGLRVALKCIRGAAATENAVRLFRREIGLARQIADPNVCRVHDVFEHFNESGAILLLSMELIDGETLQDRLTRVGALPLREAAPLVYQLLSGIAAAHRAGVIHRDLKPANIMLAAGQRGEGERLVIMDFGIARQQQATPAETTVVGAGIAGTFEYMAPEQLLGHSAAASDIYTAGLIIFEMLAGRKPFPGEPLQQVLRRLAEPPPRLRSLALQVPKHWDYVVDRCLQRIPERRFPSAERVARALQGDSLEGGISGVLWWARQRWQTLSAVAVLIAVAFALGALALLPRDGPIAGLPLSPVTTGGGLTGYSTISADGAWLAYVSDRETDANLQLWVQKAAEESTRRRITTDEFGASSPWFSADARKLIFRWERDGGGLYVVDLPAGTPRLLVRSGIEGRFSPDGQQVVYWTGEQAEHPTAEGAIYLIPAAGGEPRRLVSDFTTANNPVFLPDGRHILFEGIRKEYKNYETSVEWHVLDLDTGVVHVTGALEGLRSRRLRRYNRLGNFFGDRLLFSARSVTAANIYQYSFHPDTYKVRGAPQQLTFSTALLESPSVADNGLMAVTNSSGSLNVWQLPLGPNATDRRLTGSLYYDTRPTVSADGAVIAFGRSLGREREIWLRTAAGERPLVADKGEEKYWPVIRADGSEVAYSGVRENLHSLFISRASDRAIKKICDDCGDPLHFTRDGNGLLVFQGAPARLAVLDRRTRRSVVVAQTSSDLGEAQFAPGGRFIAFRENAGADRSRLWIAPLDLTSPAAASRWIPITSADAWNDKPRWSEDGRTIYFLSNRDGSPCIWAQRLTAVFQPVNGARPVRHFHSHTFSPWEASRLAFNFSVVRGNIIANPAVVHGNVWIGRLFDGN